MILDVATPRCLATSAGSILVIREHVCVGTSQNDDAMQGFREIEARLTWHEIALPVQFLNFESYAT